VIVLGFDTATQATVVGLRLADGAMLQARDEPAPHEHPGHATRLLEMAAALLARAGIGWGELQRIAVGLGPGRFTGLRVGIATARALAQSLEIELAGVSSLQALGLAAGRDDPGAAILAVIDARRREAFAAAYPPGVDFTSRRRAHEPLDGEIELPRALGADQLRSIVEELERRGAAGGRRWLAVGDGALCFAHELEHGGVTVAAGGSPLHTVDPLAICELGATLAEPGPPEQILPDYRRTPDAAPARERPLSVGGGEA
jgi:tRNA threonylcarbamoyladenosine biosynthesis protein TsaB